MKFRVFVLPLIAVAAYLVFRPGDSLSPARSARRLNVGGERDESEGRARSRSELEERHKSIAVAAYYRAELRGFARGLELDDWLAAEKDIDRT